MVMKDEKNLPLEIWLLLMRLIVTEALHIVEWEISG